MGVFQTQVMLHLNEELKPALERNYQETMEQKREATAWSATLKDEIKFLHQKAVESDQKLALCDQKLALLARENDTLRGQVMEFQRSQAQGGFWTPLFNPG